MQESRFVKNMLQSLSLKSPEPICGCVYIKRISQLIDTISRGELHARVASPSWETLEYDLSIPYEHDRLHSFYNIFLGTPRDAYFIGHLHFSSSFLHRCEGVKDGLALLIEKYPFAGVLSLYEHKNGVAKTNGVATAFQSNYKTSFQKYAATDKLLGKFFSPSDC
jgi:hypothetical protein